MAYSSYNSNRPRFDGVGTNESREEAGLGWGNNIAAVRWNHVFNQRLFANFTGTFTKYRFRLFSEYDNIFRDGQGNTTRDFYTASYSSGIRDLALKADFDFIPNPQHYIRWGAMMIDHRFTPGVFVARENEDQKQGKSYSSIPEMGVYRG